MSRQIPDSFRSWEGDGGCGMGPCWNNWMWGGVGWSLFPSPGVEHILTADERLLVFRNV